MKFRRFIRPWLLVAGILAFLVPSDADAFARRRVIAVQVPAVNYYAWPDFAVPAYPYSPYVMPLPAYGILPPPLATYNMLYGSGYLANPYGYYRSGDGSVRDTYETPARKRPSAYPAIPFGQSPEVRVTDLRRVRYEIGVPYENAIVLIDGAKTTQTGLNRVFVTPPLEEEKQYTVTITVQWTDQDRETRIRKKEFTVVAGETVRHTFVE